MHGNVFAIVLGFALAMPPMQAHAANAELNAEVPAGATRTLRLRQLPQNASLGLRIETSGLVRVIFVHENGLRRSDKRPRPLFTGSADSKLAFRITIPIAGTYYVILDNRKGTEAREVRVLIDARPPTAPKPAAPSRPQSAPGLKST